MTQILNLLSLLGLAANFGTLLMHWSMLPDKVPVHFNIMGTPDRWGGKSTLILMPVIAFSTYLIVTLAVHFGRPGNSLVAITPENAERQAEVTVKLTSWIKTEIVWLFAFIEWQSIQVAIGRATGLTWQFLPVTRLVIFGTIGYYIWLSYQLR